MTLRPFTREEDEWIMKHVNGKLSCRDLQRVTKRALRTLHVRAFQLGVSLRRAPPRIKIGPDRWQSREMKPQLEDGTSFSLTVGEDALLAALYKYHPEKVGG